jgi:DNA topoisomerase I
MSDRRAMAARKGAAVKKTAAPSGRAKKTQIAAIPLPTAEDAGLRFVNDGDPGISRRLHGKLFRYVGPDGRRITDPQTLARIRSLAIPPAWTDVWIARHANGHIQATGRDARKRKQYRYHPDWAQARNDAKFDRLLAFGRALPALRTATRDHMAARGLGRQKVLATVAHLLETTLIRVGNREYAKTNKSFGLTTLLDRHVSIDGSQIQFKFRGKTGKEWCLKHSHRRVARIVKSCQDLPGQHLFQYEDENGETRQVTSQDVNDYLRETTGMDVSAKDFRTWAGTVLAAMALREYDRVDTQAAAQANVRRAIEAVASRLGNTATICRKCYIHPEILACYLEGSLLDTLNQKIRAEIKHDLADLPPEEAATLALLHSRLSAT